MIFSRFRVKFSVAKATLQSQMSVRSFVRLSVLKQNPPTAWNHHPSSSFIIFHQISSTFINFHHPSSSFISRLLSFSACFHSNTAGSRKWFVLWILSLNSYYQDHLLLKSTPLEVQNPKYKTSQFATNFI